MDSKDVILLRLIWDQCYETFFLSQMGQSVFHGKSFKPSLIFVSWAHLSWEKAKKACQGLSFGLFVSVSDKEKKV